MTIESNLPVCIHAGMPKTGTTTLQREVFDRIAGLAQIGKPFPPTAAGVAWAKSLRRLSSEASWDEADRNQAAAALTGVIEERPADFWPSQFSVLLSWERLYDTKGPVGPIDRAARVIGILRSAGFHGDLHYWLTTREPIAFMESQYLNFVRPMKRAPTLAEWVEKRFEQWELFDYRAMRESIQALDGITSVTFVPMNGIFERDPGVIGAVADAISLDAESRERFVQALSEAPRLKARPEELHILFRRLRYEFAEQRIPLGWAISLFELAASRFGAESSPAEKPTKLAAIRSDLSGYGKDGLRGSSERPPRS